MYEEITHGDWKCESNPHVNRKKILTSSSSSLLLWLFSSPRAPHLLLLLTYTIKDRFVQIFLPVEEKV